MGGKVSYLMSKRSPVPVGVGTNLSTYSNIQEIILDVISDSQLFTDNNGYISTSGGTGNGGTGNGSGVVPTVRAPQLWQNQPVVIHFLRRFGCPICRNNALNLAKLYPILHKYGIRLVAVGLSYDSLDSFLTGNYWNPNYHQLKNVSNKTVRSKDLRKEEAEKDFGNLEVFVDKGRRFYAALGLGKQNAAALVSKIVVKQYKDAKKNKVRYTVTGDGLSLGGTYAINTKGIVLFEHQQKMFGDNPDYKLLLKALNIPQNEIDNLNLNI